MGVAWGSPPRPSLFATLFTRAGAWLPSPRAGRVPAAASTARDLAAISARQRALGALGRASTVARATAGTSVDCAAVPPAPAAAGRATHP
jgi:hypothetical protein